MTEICEQCGKECIIRYREKGIGIVRSISCPDCKGSHASGDFSYLCGSDYCRCCQ